MYVCMYVPRRHKSCEAQVQARFRPGSGQFRSGQVRSEPEGGVQATNVGPDGERGKLGTELGVPACMVWDPGTHHTKKSGQTSNRASEGQRGPARASEGQRGPALVTESSDMKGSESNKSVNLRHTRAAIGPQPPIPDTRSIGRKVLYSVSPCLPRPYSLAAASSKCPAPAVCARCLLHNACTCPPGTVLQLCCNFCTITLHHHARFLPCYRATVLP
jgi:hypothetical protein